MKLSPTSRLVLAKLEQLGPLNFNQLMEAIGTNRKGTIHEQIGLLMAGGLITKTPHDAPAIHASYALNTEIIRNEIILDERQRAADASQTVLGRIDIYTLQRVGWLLKWKYGEPL
jgi:DNA-binding HxlR family transcriptional regulator